MQRFIITIFLLLPSWAGSQVEPAYEATYRVTFVADWSANTHPVNFPGDPHFSGLIGATHGADTHLWQVGQLATAGIESMAETGSKALLTNEINGLINNQTAEFLLSGPGMGSSPGSVNMEFSITQAQSRVSLVTMIAPSPDWFVGVDGLNLRDEGQWQAMVVVDLHAYDSGTDSGTNYTSGNQNTNPAEPISRINDVPFNNNPILGQFVFELIDTQTDFPLSGAHSGLYFDPANAGDGVTLIISESEDRNFVLFTWYTYRDGQQMWLAGSADFEPGDTEVELELFRTTGASFGMDFDGNDVEAILWGTLRVSLPRCGFIDLDFTGSENSAETGSIQYSQLAGVGALQCE